MELKRLVNIRNVLCFILAFIINIGMFLYANKDMLKNYHMSNDDLKLQKQKEQLEYNSTYKADIQNIVKKADSLMEHKLFNDREKFAYNNIVKTKNDYVKCVDITLTTADTTAVSQIMDYSIVWVIALVMSIYIINQLHMERDNGVWYITYASAKGRVWLSIVRVSIVMLVTLVVSMCMYCSVVVISIIGYRGVEGLTAPLQNLSTYRLSTIRCNMIEFILLNYVWSYIALLAITMIIYMLMSVMRNRKNVVIATVAIGITEYLFYVNIEPYSIYGFFRDYNIIRLFYMNEICTFYHNIGFSTYVVSQADVLLVILILVITISSFVVLLSAKILKPYTKKSVLSVVSGRLTYVYQLILYKSPHMYKELHKCIFTSRGKWAIIGMILAIIYFSLSDLKYFSDIENYNDKIYLKYGGQNYSEIANIVTEKKNEYILVQEKLIELRKGYESGEVSVIVYAGYADYSKSVAQSMEAMKELDDKIEYLSNLKQESDIDGYLMSDRGYEQIFGKESVVRTVIISIIMLICIMILAFGNVNNEYRAKMNELIISTKLGEKRVYVHKMTVCALVSAFVSIVVCLIELYIMASHYGLPYLSAPIQSLSFMRYVDINVNILQWIIMLIMIKMVAATVVAVILFSLFYIVKRKRA